MTAEIAILNKTAVALATDSAVTLSTGTTRHKMFDSGDKLFELCDANPIGVMINNSLDFVGVPLPSLVRQFRAKCQSFSTVQQAAEAFQQYLNEEGAAAPQIIADRYVDMAVLMIAEALKQRVNDEMQRQIGSIMAETSSNEGENFPDRVRALHAEVWEHQISVLERSVSSADAAEFVGQEGVPELTPERLHQLSAKVETQAIPEEYVERIAARIVFPYLVGDQLTSSHTGIIIAGFGSSERFPTLVSFRIEGMVFGALKFVHDQTIDIDRVGRRAAVIPFAQREMVDRFIYGFDDPIQREIATFCEANLQEFRRSVEGMLVMESEEEREAFETSWQELQDQYMHALRTHAFEAVRSTTQKSVEDMVEFMPKPELARMAEALIEVTSLKRRVTQGMETVAGPIDVAVISQSEGFVWVKRKHYFPAELNPRHAARVSEARQSGLKAGEGNA